MIFEKEYAITRVRAMKGKLLKKETLDSIKSAKTKESLVNSLHKTIYGREFADVKDITKEHTALETDLNNAILKIRKFIPGIFKNDMNYILEKKDMQNLKIILRNFYAEKNTDKESLFKKGKIYSCFCGGGITNLETLGNELKHTPYYAPYMTGYIQYKETGNLQDIEKELEKQNTKISHASEELRKFLQMNLELDDFCVLVRLEKKGLSKENTNLHFKNRSSEIMKKYNSLLKDDAPLEQKKEEYITTKLKETTTNDPFSFLVVIDYLTKKEREIRTLQTCLKEVVA
ncbi:MAG: V-type ATPase subunit [Candidatus Aenigmarchaeota archaeon]|nr:V-type ATPase subunit [Candidatus Aenigmarchaeota archaeon]